MVVAGHNCFLQISMNHADHLKFLRVLYEFIRLVL